MGVLIKTFSLALLAAALSAGVAAQPAPMRGPAPFSAYDSNADGVVTPAEFAAFRAARQAAQAAAGMPMYGAATAPSFEALDVDRDGTLSPAELQAGQRGPGMGPGAGMGRNMPGFADYDLNGDGQISADEFDEARTARVTGRAAQGAMMRGLADAPSFADIDSDGDGAISAAEFDAHQQLRRPGGR